MTTPRIEIVYCRQLLRTDNLAMSIDQAKLAQRYQVAGGSPRC